jgi:hypothetical protein
MDALEVRRRECLDPLACLGVADVDCAVGHPPEVDASHGRRCVVTP